MTPTLLGRIQTRILLLAVIGLPWTILVSPLLPRGGGSLGDVYSATILAIVIVAFFGVGWELLYHVIQQYRWEKDWPILFSLLVGIPEGLWAFIIVDGIIAAGPSGAAFFLHFTSTWILIWLVAIGPLRLVFLRWRYNGGRVL